MRNVLLCLIIVFSLYGCKNGPRDLSDIKKDGTINVAMSYNPLGFYRTEDSIVGIQYKMINDFCDYSNLKCNIKIQADLNTCIEGLKKGDFDIIVKLIPVTTELKAQVEFTNAICIDKQVLVQRKENSVNQSIPFIRSQLELPGHCISMPKGSPYIARLKNLEKEIGDTLQIEEIDNYQSEQLIILVAKGDLDYTVCNYNLAKKIGGKYKQLDFRTPISFSQMQAWAVNKDSKDLLDSLNDWIDKNSNKYF